MNKLIFYLIKLSTSQFELLLFSKFRVAFLKIKIFCLDLNSIKNVQKEIPFY